MHLTSKQACLSQVVEWEVLSEKLSLSLQIHVTILRKYDMLFLEFQGHLNNAVLCTSIPILTSWLKCLGAANALSCSQSTYFQKKSKMFIPSGLKEIFHYKLPSLEFKYHSLKIK